jgi:hypothetical protein
MPAHRNMGTHSRPPDDDAVFVTVRGAQTSNRASLTISTKTSEPLGFILNSARPNRPIRFSVGAPGHRSTIWKTWANKNKSDVYVASRKTASIFKVSLHESGDWRIQFIGLDHGTVTFRRLDDTEQVGRIMSRWRRPAPTGPGWTDALSIWIPGQDVSHVPNDNERSDDVQWIPDPGPGRVVEIRLVLVDPSLARTVNISAAIADTQSAVSFVNGFRLANGEVLLLFARDEPLIGKRLQNLNKMRASERQVALENGFDLSADLGPRIALTEVESDGYRSIWDLSLAQTRRT